MLDKHAYLRRFFFPENLGNSFSLSVQGIQSEFSFLSEKLTRFNLNSVVAKTAMGKPLFKASDGDEGEQLNHSVFQ